MLLNDLKNQIVKTINDSNLSIDAIYYVMKDIMNEIISQYNVVLQQEAAAAASAKEEAQLEETEEAPSADNQIKED